MKNYKNILLFNFILSIASFNITAMNNEDAPQTPQHQPVGNHQFITPDGNLIIPADNTPRAIRNGDQEEESVIIARCLLNDFIAEEKA